MADRERLETVLGEFYDRLRDGADLEELIRSHPDLEEEIRAHFDLLEFVDRGLEAERSRESGRPKRIGEYRIIRELGRGGMGVVYEAEQTSMNRRVALKVLSPSVTSAAQAVTRFEREARAAGKLHHQNIAPVYGMGRDRGFHYYAMELVDGRSLGEVIAEQKTGADETRKKSGPFGTSTQGREHFVRLAEAIAGVAEALHAAHEEGVVHRDVKPGNLLLAPDGTLKLVDFGLARLAGEGAGMTATGQILGTPHYMSPEQARARRVAIDYRTDIYSLGATLYEALTLETPFTGDSIPAVCSAIINTEPRSPRKVDPRIPEDLQTIVQKAMEKDRDRRYATAQEMAKDLRRFAVGMPIRARRIGRVTRAWRKVKRNKVRTGLVAAVLVLAAVAAGFMMHASDVSTRLREAEYEQLIARAGDAMAFESATWEPTGVASAMPIRDTATVLLSRAIELNPDRAEAYWLRALAAGRTIRQRHDDLDLAGELGLAPGTAHLLRALLFRMAGRSGEAEEEGRLAAAHDDGSPLGQYAKARLLAAEHRRSDAIAAATLALSHPGLGRTVRAHALRLRAHLRLKTEDWPGAHADFVALGTLGDKSIRTRVQIASLWRKLDRGDVGEGQFVDLLEEAEAADDPGLWESVCRACWVTHELAWGHRAVKRALAGHEDHPGVRGVQAWSLLKRGEMEDALQVADLLLEDDPDNPEGYELRAQALQGLDRPGEALEAIRRWLELAGPLARAFVSRGIILSNCLGDHRQAQAAFQSALELDPGSYTARLNLGIVLRNLGEWQGALETFTRATELEPGFTDAWEQRWILLTRLGRWEEALEEMKTTASREATTARTLHLRGHALSGLTRFKDALAAFEEASRLEAEAQAGAFHDRDCLLLDRIWALKEMKLPDLALEACEEAILALDPSTVFALGAWCFKIEVLSEAGEHQAALDSVDQAMNLRSNSVVVCLQMVRARVLMLLGNYRESLTQIREGLKTHPHSAELWLLKGVALAETGEPEKAREAFRTYIRAGPTMPGAGGLIEQLRRPRETIAALEDALPAASEGIWKLQITAWLHFWQRRFDPALKAATNALKLNPENEALWNMRGTILCDKKQDYEGALQAFDRAISLNDRYAPFHMNRGIALSGLGESRNSIEAFTRSIALQPTFKDAWSNRAVSYWRLTEYEKACADYAEAHRLQPDSLATLCGLVNALRYLGKNSDAESAAKKYVNCDLRYIHPNQLAWICAMAGDRERALAVIRRMGPPTSPGGLYSRACCYALLGEIEPALKTLEQAIEAGYRRPANAPDDPDFESLEQDPRYRTLLEQLRGN